MKRRKFLTLVVLTASVTTAGSIAYRKRNLLAAFAHSRYRQQLVLDPAPTGNLSDETLATLFAATEGVLANLKIQPDYYKDYFRFRAARLPGYLALYNQFASQVNQAAQKAVGKNFTACDVATRAKIVEQATRTRSTSAAEMLTNATFAADWIRFDEFITREILWLFARTDAFLIVGYKSHPGVVRGLQEYKLSPV